MRKVLFWALVAVLTATAPLTVNAATFVLTPNSATHKIGDTFVVTIAVSPAGTGVYTTKLDAKVSSELEIVSFTLNDNLLALKAPGYDSLDIAAGLITKTGGYTGGTTVTAPFGTLVLRARTAGTGEITVLDSSEVLGANNSDTQSGAQVGTYNIIAKPAVEQSARTPQSETVIARNVATTSSSERAILVEGVEDDEESTATTTSGKEFAAPAQAAAVSGAPLGVWHIWLAWLLSMVVAFLGGYFIGITRRRK